MYGPLQNAPGNGHWGRGWAIEDVDATLSSTHVSVHSCGNRSGLPLWGSKRRIKSPLVQEMIHGRTSPLHHGELSSSGYLTVSTAERTTSPASSNEKDSFGYLDLLNQLPSMQNGPNLACEGTEEDQMWESESVLTQALLRDNEVKDVRTLTNYAILVHGYHDDLSKAAVLLEEAIKMKPDDMGALNAYGTILHDVYEKVRPIQDKNERDLIFDRGESPYSRPLSDHLFLWLGLDQNASVSVRRVFGRPCPSVRQIVCTSIS